MYKKAFIECDLVILVLDVGLHEKKNHLISILFLDINDFQHLIFSVQRALTT